MAAASERSLGELQKQRDRVSALQDPDEDLFTLARLELGQLTLDCRPTDIGAPEGHAVDA